MFNRCFNATLSHFINFNYSIYNFLNSKTLAKSSNISIGLLECSLFLASALILKSVLSGEENNFFTDIFSSFLFFIIGQIGFMIYALLYNKFVQFNLKNEIEGNNIAAALSFHNLIASEFY